MQFKANDTWVISLDSAASPEHIALHLYMKQHKKPNYLRGSNSKQSWAEAALAPSFGSTGGLLSACSQTA